MPDVISQVQLTAFLPALARPDAWTAALNTAMDRFEINTPQRAAAFLAQVAHESGEFKRLIENLSYSVAGLMKTWPTRFPTIAAAQPFERNQELIANRVYAGRLGNGDSASGDGWRFKGRGLIQLTGRGNYRSCGTAITLPLETQPELLEAPDAAALSAAQFWNSRGLNHLADDTNTDNDDEDFKTITRIINNGLTGLASRQAYWARAKTALA